MPLKTTGLRGYVQKAIGLSTYLQGEILLSVRNNLIIT